MNFVKGEVARDGAGPVFRAEGGAFTVALREAFAGLAGRRVVLGVRPEHLELAATDSPYRDDSAFEARIESTEPLGNETFLFVRAGEHELTARAGGGTPPVPGDEAWLTVDGDRVHLFDPESGASLRTASP